MDKEEKLRMKDTILEEISEEDCEDSADMKFKCENCGEIERCFYKASQKISHDFAKSLDYGGYDTEEEFWENLD